MGGVSWHIIVVDDTQGEDVKALIEGNAIVEEPDRIEVTVLEDFDVAIAELPKYRFDLVVLDLKDDAIDLDGDAYKGNAVFEKIKKTQFCPVVFYTAHPRHAVINETPFVKVVTRGEISELLETISSFIDTKLPHISRHIEDEKIKYMWSFLEEKKSEFFKKNAVLSSDLAYLLSRRLSFSLKRESIKTFVSTLTPDNVDENSGSNIRPIEMYLMPPLHPTLLGGDILRSKKGRYFLVVSPSCDLEQNKADYILLAKCELVRDQPEFSKFQKCIKEEKEISNSARSELEALVANNRKGQRDRYVCLPGAMDLPYLVADFQQICRVKFKSIIVDYRVASLDSPYAEAVLSKFTNYYSRIGTPDVERDTMLKGLEDIEKLVFVKETNKDGRS
jgi:hypothetical protein